MYLCFHLVVKYSSVRLEVVEIKRAKLHKMNL